MKKYFNKKIISIAIVLIVVAMISGIFYMKNKTSEPKGNKPITATLRKAAFSSVVNVTLSDAGKNQYKGASKYQIYYEGKAITQKEQIGKPTTAYPARNENDKVVVKLLKADDSEAYSVDLNLQKEAKVK